MWISLLTYWFKYYPYDVFTVSFASCEVLPNKTFLGPLPCWKSVVGPLRTCRSFPGLPSSPTFGVLILQVVVALVSLQMQSVSYPLFRFNWGFFFLFIFQIIFLFSKLISMSVYTAEQMVVRQQPTLIPILSIREKWKFLHFIELLHILY